MTKEQIHQLDFCKKKRKKRTKEKNEERKKPLGYKYVLEILSLQKKGYELTYDGRINTRLCTVDVTEVSGTAGVAEWSRAIYLQGLLFEITWATLRYMQL